MEGACVRIEREAPGGLPFIWLACRRHKLERDFNAAFRAVFPGPTKSPADDLCEKVNDLVEAGRLPASLDETNRFVFRDRSAFLDQQRERIDDVVAKMAPTAGRNNALPRDDYRFYLNLVQVGPRSASRVVFSHSDGGLGWLRGWLVPVLRRGCFLATVMVV